MQKRTVCILLAITVFLCGGVHASAAGAATDAADTADALWLEAKRTSLGIEAVLYLSSANGICGLLASLVYDADAVVLTSCGIADGGGELTLSYKDKEGRVSFLLDGHKNCAPSGELVSFYFTVKGNAPKSFDFYLELASGQSAFALTDEGEIKAIAPDLSRCRVSVFDETEVALPPSNVLLGVYAVREGERLSLFLSGRPASENLALGFKIFAVDVATARTQTALVISISRDDEVSFCAELFDCEGAVCVIVTPLIYNGRTVSEGQKSAFVFW